MDKIKISIYGGENTDNLPGIRDFGNYPLGSGFAYFLPPWADTHRRKKDNRLKGEEAEFAQDYFNMIPIDEIYAYLYNDARNDEGSKKDPTK